MQAVGLAKNLPEEPAEGRMAEQKEAAALALNGLQALAEAAAEKTRKDAINGARRALLAKAQTRLVEAEAALVIAEKAKDKKAIDRANINLFEAKCRLADIQYSQRDMEAPDTQPPAQGAAAVPPVIQAVLDEGLLETIPLVNGKYSCST
jgi:hypothetical protein